MTDFTEQAQESVDQWSSEDTIRVYHGDRLKHYLANLLTAAYEQGLEDAAKKIRADCPNCDGGNCVDGYGEAYECDVCGTALLAIRALKERP